MHSCGLPTHECNHLGVYSCIRRLPICRPTLVSDIVRACALERAASAVDAALQAIMQMCALADLQAMLLQQGVLGYLVPLLLGYDSTLSEESGSEEAATAQLVAADSAAEAGRKVSMYLGLSMQRSNMQVGRRCMHIISTIGS